MHAFILGAAWTPNGQEIIFNSNHAGLPNLWRARIAGGELEPVAASTDYGIFPTVAPRGYRLAFVRSGADTNLWKIAISPSKAKPVRIVASTHEDSSPAFSPDGRRLAFGSDRSGSYEVYVSNADGSNQLQLTSLQAPDTGTPRWSPDGKQIAFDSRHEGHSDIFLISADGGTPRRLTSGPYDSETPAWPHDGKWIYFSVERSGTFQLWKLSADGGPPVQITPRGGLWPNESLDGRFVYYFHDRAVWQYDLAKGTEAHIVDMSQNGEDWRLCGSEVCVADRSLPAAGHLVRYKLSGQSRQSIAVDFGPLIGQSLGIDVSSDGSWLVYSRADSTQSDIMLVENFH